jgi:hypothetical protein
VLVPYHIADLQIFEIDRVVASQQRQRRLVMEVAALPLDALVLLGELCDRFTAAVTE